MPASIIESSLKMLKDLYEIWIACFSGRLSALLPLAKALKDLHLYFWYPIFNSRSAIAGIRQTLQSSTVITYTLHSTLM